MKFLQAAAAADTDLLHIIDSPQSERDKILQVINNKHRSSFYFVFYLCQLPSSVIRILIICRINFVLEIRSLRATHQ
jgi:hypothetical protein